MSRKYYYSIIAVLLLALLMPATGLSTTQAGWRTFTISLKRELKEYSEPTHDLDDEGNRKPQRPMTCVISETEGVQCGIPKEEIEAYEIRTAEDEIILLSTTDESEFIDYLFSMPEGDYMLIIVTEDYNFVGYI